MHRSFVGRCVNRLLLLMAVLGFMLSLLDPSAAARAPWHDHIVLGAHGLKEWAHVLASHRHTSDGWSLFQGASLTAPEGSMSTGVSRAGAPRVISLNRASDGIGTSVFDIGGQIAADPGDFAVPALTGTERVRVPGTRMLLPLPPPVPDPPPRASS